MLGNLRDRLFSPIRSSSSAKVEEGLSKNQRSPERVEKISIEDRQRNRRSHTNDNAGSSQTSSLPSLDAGATLLDSYQNEWTRLHDVSEENAKCAGQVDAAIDQLVRTCDQRREVITAFLFQLSSLPGLKDSVQQLTTRLNTLEAGFSEIERLLLTFEDTIELQRLQERQLEVRFQLALYKERKMSQLEVYKEKLAAEREVRISKIVAEKDSLLRERQETFGEAFEEEMKHYKEYGRVETRVGSVEGDNDQDDHRLRLEDIELDQEDDDLDTFLATEATEDVFDEQKGKECISDRVDNESAESSATEPE